jgi:hypothetical protein
MGKRHSSSSVDHKIKVREGYQGRPLRQGVKVVPPPGAAADVPAKTGSAEKSPGGK